MALYRKRTPPALEAEQWWKHGDHPGVQPYNLQPPEFAEEPHSMNARCGQPWSAHGWIVADAIIVCPGDYILANGEGGWTIAKQKQFEAVYELVLP